MPGYPQIVFYDIHCETTKQPWSPFTTRTYLALRILGIPFQHEYIPMCKIGPTLSAAELPKPKDSRYTLPAITMSPPRSGSGEKEWVTESETIAALLQQLYLENGGDLSRSLFPDEASNQLASGLKEQFTASLYTKYHRWKSITPMVYHILDPESQGFFHETRISDWGKSPKEIIETDAKENAERDGGVDKVYAKAMEPFEELYENKKKKKGLWLGGDNPIYADIKVLGMMQWFKCANGEAFEGGLKAVGGALEKAWIAGQVYFTQS